MEYIKPSLNHQPDTFGPRLLTPNGQAPAIKALSSRTLNKAALTSGRVALDLALIYGAFVVTYFWRYAVIGYGSAIQDFAPVSFDLYLAIGAFFTLVLFTVLYAKRYYLLSRRMTFGQEVPLILSAVTVSTAMVVMFFLLTLPAILVSRLLFIYLVPITALTLAVASAVRRSIRREMWRRGIGVDNLLVVGATDAGVWLMRAATANVGLGYKLVGFVDDRIRYSHWTLPARYGNSVKRTNAVVPHLGTLPDLDKLIARHAVQHVAIALPAEDYQTARAITAQCHAAGISVTIVPDLPQSQMSGIHIPRANGVQLIGMSDPAEPQLSYLVKYAIDRIGAFLLLALFAVPITIIAIAIKFDSPGPAIFRQVRVGKNGREFTFYKFRSMYTDADARLAELTQYNLTNGATFKMVNDPRVTRIGRFLRSTSLDELPQLFNVLCGQMSLVGPRPGLPREVALYQPWHFRRLEVMPGLTGLWQVSGRSDLTFDDMVKIDIYYAEHWSLWLDLTILLNTVRAVLKAEGAY